MVPLFCLFVLLEHLFALSILLKVCYAPYTTQYYIERNIVFICNIFDYYYYYYYYIYIYVCVRLMSIKRKDGGRGRMEGLVFSGQHCCSSCIVVIFREIKHLSIN